VKLPCRMATYVCFSLLQALTALEQKRRFALATVSTRREEAGKLT
jgi:hypothetical protein